MKLQARLSTLFAFITLIPLVFVSYLSYLTQRQALLETTVERLEVIADVQERRFEETASRYLETARQFAFSSPVQDIFFTHNAGGEVDADVFQMAVATLDFDRPAEVFFIDLQGEQLFSTEAGAFASTYLDSNDETVFLEQERLQIFKDDQNRVRVRIHEPVYDGSVLMGYVELIQPADLLFAITEDYTGLGETGEVLLGKKNVSGDALFITPLRHDAAAALRRAVSQRHTNVPITSAVAGQEAVFLDDATVDHRGVPVIAVTRYIEGPEWGMVVKIDRDEALDPVYELGRFSLSVGVLSVLLVVMISALTVRSVVRPVKQLTLFAQNLRKGNFSMFTEVTGNDEIGFLATTLNTMTKRLRTLYQGLEQKVKERTQQLEEAQRIGSFGSFTWHFQKGKNEWSDQSFRLHGLEVPEDGKPPSLKDYFQFIHPDDVPAAQKRLRQAMRSAKENTYMYRVVRKDGAVRHMEVRYQVTFDKQKKPLYIRGTFRDITREREVDQAKTEFVSLASHQLRTPLSTIKWYAEILLGGDAGTLTKDQEKYLHQIYQGNQRMVELVNSLLNVSRLELGTFVVEPVPTDLVALATSVIEEQAPKIKQKKQVMETHFPKRLVKIPVDPQLLRMVFQNLLSNAVKYTPEKGRVSMSINMEKDQVVVKVSDTGMGIPKSEQDKIFTKLFRATNVREQDTEGTGLGLYIVKSVIEHSGGTVSFTSEQDKGTTFMVTLPKAGMKKKQGSKQLS